MTWEEFEQHKAFAGEKKPSMLRWRVGHDYHERRVYLITMTVAGRRPLLGRLVGNAEAAVAENMQHARNGAVLVSPAISDGESAVMRAALDGGLPLIFLTPWGFNVFSKPGHQYYEACAAGRFLILAPWPHQTRRVPQTRQMCLQLNTMAKEILRVVFFAATMLQHRRLRGDGIGDEEEKISLFS